MITSSNRLIVAEEVLVRAKAVLRRVRGKVEQTVTCGDITLNRSA